MARITREQKLKWLAESLTNEQIAKLLEAEAPDPMQGVPTNPGMETVDNPGAMKPVQQDASQAQPQGQYTEDQIVDFLVKALQAGTIARAADPSGVLKIIGKNPAQVMMKAISKACSMVETSSNSDKNIVKGISALLTVLLKQKFSIGESVASYLNSNSVDAKQLASNVRDKNVNLIYEAGKVAAELKAKPMLNEMKSSIASLKKSLSSISSPDKVAAISKLSESVEILSRDDMTEKINEFYNCSTVIKKVTTMLKESGVNLKKFNNIQKVVSEKNKALNEMMSAVKYSVAFYKTHKKAFEK